MKTTMHTVIRTAGSLLTGGPGDRVASDNPEYDRALIELVGTMIGADTSDMIVRDTIYLFLRAVGE